MFFIATTIVTVAAVAVFRMAHVSGNPRSTNADKTMRRGALAIFLSIIFLAIVIIIGSAA